MITKSIFVSCFLLALTLPVFCFRFESKKIPGSTLSRLKLSELHDKNFLSSEDELYFDDDDAKDLSQQFFTNDGPFQLKSEIQPISELSAWKALVVDEPPPSLLEYLRREKILSPFHEIKAMELWDEIRNRRGLLHFRLEESARILEAFKVAYVAFYGKRTLKCGELMIERAKGTAAVLGELKADTDVVIAGILHDLFYSIPKEDIEAVQEILRPRIGDGALILVEKCNKLPKLMAERAVYTPMQSEYHIQILVVTAEDYRALYVRVAERVHTMRALKTLNLNSSVKEKIAQEALHVYAPLAHKMGVMKVKGELEDLAFRFDVHKCSLQILDEVRSGNLLSLFQIHGCVYV